MTSVFSKNKVLFSTFILFFFALTLSLPASANMGDWAQVKQFEKKSKLASEGNLQAMHDLGKLYERGRGTNRNIRVAAEWYQKAASAGHTSSKARLGILYFEGRGVKQNYQKALTLLNAAAKDNIPSALFQLANMYELGTGVRQDLHISIALYKRAQQYGYYLAENKIARLEQLALTGAKINNKAIQQPAKNTVTAAAPLLQTILNGRWLKRKSPVGYLPSIISNCAKSAFNTLDCISTSQERSTGSEVITYNTESIVTTINKTSFNVEYTNNVLEVALLDVEDGNGVAIEQAPSRIKKGKQGKNRTLECHLKNNKTIECRKGTSTFDLISQ